MKPNVRLASPADDRATPTRSRGRDSAALVPGMKAATAASPTTTNGTLIKKIEPHHAWDSSQPPRMGPSGRPTAVEVTQIVSARARSPAFGKIDGSTAIDNGSIRAAPAPSTIRAMMNVSAAPEYAHHTDAAPKMISASISSFL